MLGRGRGGVQVLERLGLESAENLYSPARPRQCSGIQSMCCLCTVWWEGNLLSLLLGRSNKQGWGCWAADAGEYRFWSTWGVKVLKTCTPPRARGNEGEYRSGAVFVWWEGNLLSLLLRSSNKQGWGCWAADAGSTGFGTFGA